MQQNKLGIRPEFAFLWTSRISNKVIVAARGSGKTVAVLQYTVQRLLEGEPNSSAAFFSSTLKQAAGTVEPAMRMILESFPPSVYKYNMSSHKYSFFLGGNDVRELILFSYENQESKRGFHPNAIVLDECADMPYNMYGTVIDPMLSKENSTLIAIGTAKGHDKFYELFQRGASKNYPTWESYRIKADQCTCFTPDFLWEKKQNLTSFEYAQEYDCDFEANVLVGSVYGDFFNRYTNANIKDCYCWDPELPVYTAWDLGFADYTSIWFFQVRGDIITFIDYFEDNGHETSHYADMLNKKPYHYKLHILPFDGVRNDMRGAPVKSQLERYGLKCAGLERRREEDGIDEARRLLKTCRFNSETCAIGLEHLRNFKYKIDKRTFTKLPQTDHNEHSHAADAFRYAATSKHLWKNNSLNRIIITPGQDYNVLC